MKKFLALLIVTIFALALTACGGAPKKADAVPTEAPATAPAEMPTTAPAEGEGEEKEDEEKEEGEEGAEAPKKKSLKKFEGNRMERAGDDDE